MVLDYVKPLYNSVIPGLLFKTFLFSDEMENGNRMPMAGTIDESPLTSPSSSLSIFKVIKLIKLLIALAHISLSYFNS